MTDINIDGIVTWLKNWFQEKLVSGTNLKTINNQSLLGAGNINISGGGSITVDDALDTTSENPVQNKVITNAMNGKSNTGHTHTLSNISDLTVEEKTITVTSATTGSNYFSDGTREIKAVKYGKIVQVTINFYGVNAKASGTSVDTTIGTLPTGWTPKSEVGRVKTVGSTNANLNYSQAGITTNGNIFIRVGYSTALTNVTFRAGITFITE